MKRLLLTRHAKSSWGDMELSDIERPLAPRGRRDAPFLGKLLSEQGIVPDLIIASPAARAFFTARLFASEFAYPPDAILVKNQLYEHGVADYLALLHSLDSSVETVQIVGHNPTLTYFSSFLAKITIDNVPTCGIIGISFDADEWSAITEGSGKFLFFEYPKKYLS